MVMITQEVFQELLTLTLNPLNREKTLDEWVLARDNHRCQAPGCQHRQDLGVFQVDTTLPGGRHAPHNLVTMCPTCQSIWDLMGRGPVLSQGVKS